MSQIQYFKSSNETNWTAIIPGHYQESVYFWNIGSLVAARIEMQKSTSLTANYYRQPGNKYVPCSQQEYLIARHKAQSATAEFFSLFQHIQPVPAASATSALPDYPTQTCEPGPFVGRTILNDLPF